MSKEKYLDKAIAWAEKKATTSVRSVHRDYEDTKVFTSKATKEAIQADLSFTTHGGSKHFTEVALKEENPKGLVVKWKVLSFVASMKKGKLHLLAPKGHKAFTERLVHRHRINAIVHAI
ncbi:hypothetical protein J8281_10415 [Aquimarina sp. U1-2]|uniref:hypothetical protein n=1 Tax=Aquimarina sp. U1-2 TaxID=2823141 RepID=UPI001AECD515|nr:hypothetical protein [Aquimarina sp. U1-2]MBP2832597.1 hypothetical protein [Aquimarina sp. U1-2]